MYYVHLMKHQYHALYAMLEHHYNVLYAFVKARLAGKYRWWEFPAVITGNYRPGKYSQFGESGKYWEI